MLVTLKGLNDATFFEHSLIFAWNSLPKTSGGQKPKRRQLFFLSKPNWWPALWILQVVPFFFLLLYFIFNFPFLFFFNLLMLYSNWCSLHLEQVVHSSLTASTVMNFLITFFFLPIQLVSLASNGPRCILCNKTLGKGDEVKSIEKVTISFIFCYANFCGFASQSNLYTFYWCFRPGANIWKKNVLRTRRGCSSNQVNK